MVIKMQAKVNPKISLICTVKKEQENIKQLLDSILNQKRKPDDIVIVDGGSTDNTVQLIRAFAESKDLPVKLIIAPNLNIAQGRNIAIKNAKYDIIACTDGGCRLYLDWLQKIIEPLEKSETDVVSGVYVPWYESEFEETAAYLIFPNIEKLNPNTFLPSGRSIAFKRKAWEAIGGYPEWLDTAEDTLFDLKLKKAGMKFQLKTDAVVYWRVRENSKKILKQFYNYAKGDGFALLFSLRYLTQYSVVAFLILLLFIGYKNLYVWFLTFLFVITAFWFRHLKKVKKPSFKRTLTAICIAFAIELGTFFGFISGFLRRVKITIKRKTLELAS